MRTVFFWILLLMNTVVFAQTKINLMPWPSEIEVHAEEYRLNESFNVTVDGPESKHVDEYASRFINRLINRTGLFITSRLPVSEPNSQSLKITYTNAAEPSITTDESYLLNVTEEGISITAKTDIGAMRGMETVLQLISSDNDGYYIPHCDIKDSPRFVWRGLLLDVCRHWMPIDVVKRNLNAMAAVKMNVLHLHLTEDQGFRVESKKYPKLHQLGSDGNYFTQDELREIVAYAGARGIRVVPEFDIPGHATSWLVGYPELASAPGPYEIDRTYGVKDPTIDPTKEYTYEFLNNFLSEMAKIFPDDFMHIGGDENNGKQWDANSDIQKFMTKKGIRDNHELQAYFNLRLEKILTANNKRMVGWDEIKSNDLPQNIVIQSWRGKQALVEAAESGYDVLLSNGYYIDLVQPASFHYLNDPISEDIKLSPEARKHVLGGEATMWAELVTKETVDSRIWPRTAAIAERLWSPASVRDVNDMYARMQEMSILLEEHGLLHLKTQNTLLRRMAGQENLETLKTLVDYIEPIEGYKRHRVKKYTSFSPFTRWPDAAQPDAFKAMEFNKLVNDYVKNNDPGLKEEIKKQLLGWIENHKQMKALAKTYPLVREALPLSDDLARISVLGMQALSNNILHNADWKQKAQAMLKNAAEPKVECEIKVIKGITILVDNAK